MALTDIIISNTGNNISEYERGNIGVLVDAISNPNNILEIPVVNSGSGAGGEYFF